MMLRGGVSLLLLAVPLAAERRWLKATSPHFELFTTAGERRAKETIQYFEQIRSLFTRFSRAAPPSMPMRLVLFSSEKEYAPYRVSEAAAAYFAPGHDRDYIVLQAAGDQSHRVAAHEYVHALVRDQKLPLWLNEGLAEFYSTLRSSGSKVYIGEIPPDRFATLQLGQWLELERLTAVDHDSPEYNERRRVGIFYAESWALVHMLVLDERYRQRFPDFVAALDGGATHEEAFLKAYEKRPWEMWMALKEYLGQTRFNVGIFEGKLDKDADEPVLAEGTELETGLVLAELLGQTRRTAEASEAYAKLASANPDVAGIEEAQGYLCRTAGDSEAAQRHFARAVELGSGNARMYVDYAVMLRRGGAGAAETLPLLEKAVKLRPQSAEAQFWLGAVLLDERRWEDALKALGGIRQVGPEHAFSVFHAMAYAHLRLGNTEQSRKAAERAKQYARSDKERGQAEEILSYLDRPARPALAVAAPAATQAQGAHVDGVLEQVDCIGEKARLRVRVAGRLWRLAVHDRQALVRPGGASFALACGAQPAPRRVTIDYEAVFDSDLGTQGNVLGIEFR